MEQGSCRQAARAAHLGIGHRVANVLERHVHRLEGQRRLGRGTALAPLALQVGQLHRLHADLAGAVAGLAVGLVAAVVCSSGCARQVRWGGHEAMCTPRPPSCKPAQSRRAASAQCEHCSCHGNRRTSAHLQALSGRRCWCRSAQRTASRTSPQTQSRQAWALRARQRGRQGWGWHGCRQRAQARQRGRERNAALGCGSWLGHGLLLRPSPPD